MSVLFIGSCENGWKSYGNNCYLFGINKINWHEAKVSKIVINKIKSILYIYVLIHVVQTNIKYSCTVSCNILYTTKT